MPARRCFVFALFLIVTVLGGTFAWLYFQSDFHRKIPTRAKQVLLIDQSVTVKFSV